MEIYTVGLVVLFITKFLLANSIKEFDLPATITMKTIDVIYWCWIYFGLSFVFYQKPKWFFLTLLLVFALTIIHRFMTLKKISRAKTHPKALVISIAYLIELILAFSTINLILSFLSEAQFSGLLYEKGFGRAIDILLYTLECVLPCGSQTIVPQSIWARIVIIAEVVVFYSSLISRTVELIKCAKLKNDDQK